METYIIIGLLLLAFVIGNILGTRQFEKAQETLSRQHNLHITDMRKSYNDAITLSNQHANLATQLINELRDKPTSMNFPPPELFKEEEHPEIDEGPDPENADVAGGRI